jgi:hypothetical protein
MERPRVSTVPMDMGISTVRVSTRPPTEPAEVGVGVIRHRTSSRENMHPNSGHTKMAYPATSMIPLAYAHLGWLGGGPRAYAVLMESRPVFVRGSAV